MTLSEQLTKIKNVIVESYFFDEVEYMKLMVFMRKTIKELNGDPPGFPERILRPILEPTLIIKTRRFIKENLPGYARRIKQNVSVL